MKLKSFIVIIIVVCTVTYGFISQREANRVKAKKCVFKTVFGEVDLDTSFTYMPKVEIVTAVTKGLDWLKNAQHTDGGWGAGFHSAQHVKDPHKVPSDPATTAMVSMALLRSGTDLNSGEFHIELSKSTEFILKAIEQTPPDGSKITDLKNTQIQQKLGNNIDLVLSLQYLTNLLDKMEKEEDLYERVFNVVAKSVDIMQTEMDDKGRVKGAGWAGVLQSAFGSNALESASSSGVLIDEEKLKQSKDYQSSNYDPVSESIDTRDGAGVMLYAVSGSLRANAKEARKAREIIDKEIKNGRLSDTTVVTYDNLIKAGLDENKALTYDAAYKVYESAKYKAQQKEVLSGFGNNGGEEFISYLQTGESLIMNGDKSWKDWYNLMSANVLNIQNEDGSWNGHHCITSPVFCTATSLLILSIYNDVEELVMKGS